MPRADWQRRWREKARDRGLHQMTVHLDDREVALLDAVAVAVTVAHPDLGGDNVPRSRVPSRTAALRIVIKAALGGVPAPSHDEAALATHWVRLASWAAWRRDCGDPPPELTESSETAHEAAAAARAQAHLLRVAGQVLERIGAQAIMDDVEPEMP